MDILLIANPRSAAATPLGPAARAALGRCGAVHEVTTLGAGDDVARIAAALAQPCDAVVAAGGDGTVRAVSAALMQVAARPPLAILALGTANNVARSLGFPSVRQVGAAAIEATCRALAGRQSRSLDLGRADGEWFVGSFALGMDAAILAARNRWRARWRLGPRLGGYPLYLASCAANLAVHRGVATRLTVDGATRAAPLYNLLVANTALYAGEFRFDADDRSGDGLLDLHEFASAGAYVRGFVTAWRRHLAYERGASVVAPPLQRVRSVVIESDVALRSQLDGEEGPSATSFTVEVVPGALLALSPQRHNGTTTAVVSL
ncbi:MAG: diacylglycerol kinase family protein [Deltaproteobacteria bacterium]|nr:diacylglycerol kinase family protein [Deltaproteobacteria bacterium]